MSADEDFNNIISIEDPRIKLIWKFISISSARRYSYVNRAAIIIAADTLIAGSTVYFVDKICNISKGLPLPISIIALIALIVLFSSLFFCFQSVMDLSWVKRSHQILPEIKEGPKRIFLSPPDTIKDIGNKGISYFIARLKNISVEELFNILCSELYLDLKLQLRRYRRLQLSATLLFISFILVSIIAIYYVLNVVC